MAKLTRTAVFLLIGLFGTISHCYGQVVKPCPAGQRSVGPLETRDATNKVIQNACVEPDGTLNLYPKSISGVISANQLSGVDIGAKVNNALLQLPAAAGTAGGGKIVCEPGSHDFSTPIVLDKGLTLDCAGVGFTNTPIPATDTNYGTLLRWTGAAPLARSIVAATGASRTSNVVTITTTVAHAFAVGWPVTVTGVTDTGFNGLFKIVSAPTATTFTYRQVDSNATSGGGTAAGGGVALTILNPNITLRVANFALENAGASGSIGIDMGDFVNGITLENVWMTHVAGQNQFADAVRIGNVSSAINVDLVNVRARGHQVGLRASSVNGHINVIRSRFLDNTTANVILGVSATQLVSSFHSFGSTYEAAPATENVRAVSFLKADFVSDYWECDEAVPAIRAPCISVPAGAGFAASLTVRGAYVVGGASGNCSENFITVNRATADAHISDSYFTGFGKAGPAVGLCTGGPLTGQIALNTLSAALSLRDNTVDTPGITQSVTNTFTNATRTEGNLLNGTLALPKMFGVACANLGTPVNGTVVYCPDCTIADPCACAGTGALAKRLNNTWKCN